MHRAPLPALPDFPNLIANEPSTAQGAAPAAGEEAASSSPATLAARAARPEQGAGPAAAHHAEAAAQGPQAAAPAPPPAAAAAPGSQAPCGPEQIPDEFRLRAGGARGSGQAYSDGGEETADLDERPTAAAAADQGRGAMPNEADIAKNGVAISAMALAHALASHQSV